MNENKLLNSACVRSVKNAGRGAKQQGWASKGSPLTSFRMARNLQRYQPDRQSQHSRDLNHKHCDCTHFFSERGGLNRVQEISYLGVWHFASWKEVLGAKKMQMCDLKYRGLINMVDFLTTKTKWSISNPNQAAPSPFEEPIQRSKRLLVHKISIPS